MLAYVIVLGDVNCSPRIVSHIDQLIKKNYDVKLFGYSNFKSTTKRVSFHQIPEWTKFEMIFPKLLQLVLKFIFTLLYLMISLFFTSKPHLLVVQNPPSLPVFLLVHIYNYLFKLDTILIDWHNYGYTLTKPGIIRKIYFYHEIDFCAQHLNKPNIKHICVSKKFAQDLKFKCSIDATTVYDMPRIEVRQTHPKSAHVIFTKLSEKYAQFKDKDMSLRRTFATEMSSIPSMPYKFREDRPAIIVSSCSWTIDDRIDMLIEAFEKYDKDSDDKRNLFCIITGKGPMKEHYWRIIKKKQFKKISIVLPWIDSEDYFDLIGTADVGICLHESTSGLDLPMKVIDLFTRLVPVIALKYPCISEELVINGENGILFENGKELKNSLSQIFNQLKGEQLLKSMRENLIKQYFDNPVNTWDAEWQKIGL